MTEHMNIAELRERVTLTNEEQAALWSDTLGSRSYGQLIAEAASEKALRWFVKYLRSAVFDEETKYGENMINMIEALEAKLQETERLEEPRP